MSFENQAQEWLEKIAERDQEHYEPLWNIEKCGQTFPLLQKMNNACRRTLLGIDAKLTKMSIAAEYCYFYLCEELTLESLRQSLEWIPEMERDDVDRTKEEHSFTFISLVILTNGPVPKEVQRKIKRYRHITYYDEKKGEFGWSAGYLCVVDLKNDVMYCNALGESLRTRLQGNIERKGGFLKSLLRRKD